MRSIRATGIPTLLGMIGLACLVVVIFYPILGFEFVRLDVGGHVLENPHIRGLNWENLKQIFTSWCTTSYYPIRSLTYALDYQLWGLNPFGFELTNLLLHLTNVLLVFWLMLRLFSRPAGEVASSAAWGDALPAALSAAVFAIHPVVVEPVTWVSGREELLMTLGALACVHFHLTARRLADNGSKTRWVLIYHTLAALSCAFACLSNAVGAIIPLLIVTLDVFTLTKRTLWRILSGTAALWVIGISTFAIKKIGEYRDPPGELGAFSLERLSLVLNAYRLNIKSLVWPTDLAVFYDPLAPKGFGDTDVVLGGLAVVLSCAVLWAFRRQKAVLLGLFWFGLALGPSSQFLVHHIHRADRFLYLPLSGLAVAIAMGLRALGSTLRSREIVSAIMVAGALGLILLGRLSAAQVSTWKDAASMWENCVRVNPDNARFRISLADSLASGGQFRRAVEQYEHVLKLVPDHQRALIKLAWLLVSCADESVRDQDRAVWLVERAFERNPIFFRVLAEIRTQVAQTLAESGEFTRAIEGYRSAIEVDPGSQRAMIELALLLATCHEEELRNAREAVELAQQACLLNVPPGPRELSVLATAYAEAGELDQAVSAGEKAIASAQASGDETLVVELRSRLKSWTASDRGYQEP
ncbi:MAG: tetratricopeptide repeat protein [Planctomycetaceae bacterium]|nr:tetratricopeptide repeat protein [Planctomycetaceae bacterium]